MRADPDALVMEGERSRVVGLFASITARFIVALAAAGWVAFNHGWATLFDALAAAAFLEGAVFGALRFRDECRETIR